jgi:phosphoglycolate phosphatase-like HAD superfamily hydrolase
MPRNSNELKKFRLFWDIDGTLIRTNGAAAIPFKAAVAKHFGFNVSLDRKRFSGFTDYEIIEALARDNGLEIDNKTVDQILEDYASSLQSSFRTGQVETVNTITEVLENLQTFGNFENAIVTGNCKMGARIKLKYFDLLKFFKDENIFHSSILNKTRDQILSNAKNSLPSFHVGIVIGDSPRDITAAKNNKMKILAVATGMHDSLDLFSYNPDCVLKKDWSSSEIIEAIRKISFSN